MYYQSVLSFFLFFFPYSVFFLEGGWRKASSMWRKEEEKRVLTSLVFFCTAFFFRSLFPSSQPGDGGLSLLTIAFPMLSFPPLLPRSTEPMTRSGLTYNYSCLLSPFLSPLCLSIYCKVSALVGLLSYLTIHIFFVRRQQKKRTLSSQIWVCRYSLSIYKFVAKVKKEK